MIPVALIVVALIACYLYGTKNFSYWTLRGIKHDKPIPFFGTNAAIYLKQKSITEIATETYWKYPMEKVVGCYRGCRPELVIRDPEIAKQVLTADFLYFHPRGLMPRGSMELLVRNLFFTEGDLWRLLRQRMTPAFTSGKLKAMFPLIVERAEKLQNRALQTAIRGREIDARDLMARYTTDFIGACGFGLDADCLQQEDSAFRKLGARIFQVGTKDVILFALREMFPVLFDKVNILTRVKKDFCSLVNEILSLRRNGESTKRNDFIDLLLECQKKGTMVCESIERQNLNGSPYTASLELDDKLIVAQVYVFFAAGFETSSSATSMTLHELAHNPEVQKKVQDEIDRVLAKYNNKLSYNAIKEMTYLEWTFREGLRIFPSLGYLVRECVRKYTFKELDMTIDDGVRVLIPLQALHNDPQYFDNPSEFRPERFDPAFNATSIGKRVYLPFGEGPRACIGERLGLMQSLAGLAAVLSCCSVRPAPGAPRRPAVNPSSNIVQSVAGGLPLVFERRTVVADVTHMQ